MLEVSVEGDNVCCEVRNHGKPIPPDALQVIVDPLVQVSPDEAGGHAGIDASLGLGLFIAREIVGVHGGTIGVTSSREDGTLQAPNSVFGARRALKRPSEASNPAAQNERRGHADGCQEEPAWNHPRGRCQRTSHRSVCLDQRQRPFTTQQQHCAPDAGPPDGAGRRRGGYRDRHRAFTWIAVPPRPRDGAGAERSPGTP